jgi:hypothetical protein
VGLLDHRRTWRYRVHGSPEQCVAGFTGAFTGSGGLLVKANWDVKRSGNGAVATYRGRSGVAGLMTAFSSTASAEQEGAIGSEVTFEIEQHDGGYTTCAMWLSSRGTRLGTTADGRFFRPYMRAVEDHLRQFDPSLQVAKA